MLYIKKEINESIDEYVMDEDDILNLIEKVLGDEFRVEVESKIQYKDKVEELEREIECADVRYETLSDELDNATEEISNYEREVSDLKSEIEELEDKLKETE